MNTDLPLKGDQQNKYRIDSWGRPAWVSPEIAQIRCKAMDEMLITNWNNTVTNNDIVYHLGDVLFGKATEAVDLLMSLNFKKLFFINGNHDKAMADLQRAIATEPFPERIQDNVIYLGDLCEITVNSQPVVLCHYSLRTWSRAHHGSWQLYGHSHGTLPDDHKLLSMDVGVDVNNYKPISFKEVATYMNNKSKK